MACRNPTDSQTIFFKELPNDVDALTVARVTFLTNTTESGNLGALKRRARPDYRQFHPAIEWPSFAALARVEEVIKGEIVGPEIRVLWAMSSCDSRYHAGASGIVVGTLRQDSKGAMELLARSHRWHH